VVQRKTGITKKVKVHECGRELPGEREENVCDVKEALDLMDAQRGPMVTLHAPRYHGEKPWVVNVDVYTDTGRVPFSWVKPVILKMQYHRDGTVPAAALRIVASGDRFRMEAMLKRFVTESELLDGPEVPENWWMVRRSPCGEDRPERLVYPCYGYEIPENCSMVRRSQRGEDRQERHVRRRLA
jgi:hypothetical protein